MLCILMITMLTLAWLCAAAHPKDAGGAAGWSFAVLGLLLGVEFGRGYCALCFYFREWSCFLHVVVPILALACVVFAAVHHIHRGFWWTIFIHILSCCMQCVSNLFLVFANTFSWPDSDGQMMAEGNRQDEAHLAHMAAIAAIERQQRHRQERAKLLTFAGNVLSGKDLPCVCSWPGKYEGAWPPGGLWYRAAAMAKQALLSFFCRRIPRGSASMMRSLPVRTLKAVVGARCMGSPSPGDVIGGHVGLPASKLPCKRAAGYKSSSSKALFIEARSKASRRRAVSTWSASASSGRRRIS